MILNVSPHALTTEALKFLQRNNTVAHCKFSQMFLKYDTRTRIAKLVLEDGHVREAF